MAESPTLTWVSTMTRRNLPWDEFLKAFVDGRRCQWAYSYLTPDEKHRLRCPGKGEGNCLLPIRWDGRPLARPRFRSHLNTSRLWHWIEKVCTKFGTHSPPPRSALIASV